MTGAVLPTSALPAPGEPRAADTHCPYCALQCAMSLTPAPGTVPVQVSGREFPTNRGGLCKKGWTSAELLAREDRLTAPLMRDGAGALVPVSWEAALDRIADDIHRLQRESGRDAVGVFGGGA